jgi:hypothetical protein
MPISIFKSELGARLHAFAGDLDGSKLPAQFRLWPHEDGDEDYIAIRESLRQVFFSTIS